MKKFREYLIKKNYSNSSTHTYCRVLDYFLSWMEAEIIDESFIDQNDLFRYMEQLQNKGLSASSISSYMMAVQHYLQYKKINVGTIGHLRSKRKRKRLMIANVLPYKDLIKLYDEFPTHTNYQKRYKVMLGLIIFQALSRRDLSNLRIDAIDTVNGTIIIPETRSSNGRTLELNSKQIMPLHHLMSVVRGTFEQAEINDHFFIRKSPDLNMVLHSLKLNIRKINPTIESIKQLRSSVIHYWLEHYNLRQVQYWCGHKYVSSTEAYMDQGLKELEDDLNAFHPMGG